MTTVKLDRITLLEATERNGALRRLVRVAEVSGVIANDWEILQDALDAAGVPEYKSHLTEDRTLQSYDLILVERNPRLVPGETDRITVELIYENYVDLEEDLDDPRGGYVLGEVRCSIQQKTSNLDINGVQVTVQHTYPDTDPNHPNETIIQSGEFQYYDPERTINIRGIKSTRQPWLIANQIVARVNNQPWSGELARYWLCTSCTWKPCATGPYSGGLRRNTYYMNFEFQFNPDSWDPTVVFEDDVTNKPPANLVPDVGYKKVIKLQSCDFDAIIGAHLQGG